MINLKIFKFCANLLLFNCITININGQGLCSNPSIPLEKLPNVVVFDAKDEIPNKDNNGTVVLGKPEEEDAVAWLSLECNHTKPIRWVFDLSYETGAGLGDSYSLTERTVDDFYNSNTYFFKAEVEIKIFRPGQHSVLACVAFDDPCDRKVVELFYSDDAEYVARILTNDENQSSAILKLENAIIKTQQKPTEYKTNSTTSCNVTFTLKDFGDYIDYGFKPKGTIPIPPKTIPDRQILENAYLYHESMDQTCVNEMCEEGFCGHFYKANTKAWYLPIVFFMTDNKNLSRVVRTYHTLSEKYGNESKNDLYKKGKLKFSWEKSDKRDMMRLSLSTKRTESYSNASFYIGESISAKCHLSPFYFSFGTLLGYQMEGHSSITFISRDETDEDPGQFGDDRIAGVNFQVPVENHGKAVNVTIHCFSPVWDSPVEWGNISQTLTLLASSLSIKKFPNKLFTYPLNSTFNSTCSASGVPLPKLTVIHPENGTRIEITNQVVNDTIFAHIFISNLDNTHSGFYNCVAVNPAGLKYTEFEIEIFKPKDREVSSTLTIILTSVFGSVSALFIIVVGILLIRFRMEREEFRRLTEEAIRDFYEGEDASHIPKKDSSEVLHYANDNVKTLPYDRKYEVPHKNWRFDNTILGSGAFGVVRKGQVEIGNRKSIIAVKTVKSMDDIDDFRATLLELKIMAHIGAHRHIVQLIAASTEEIKKRNVFIGVEYCASGDLLSYLQKRKKLFNNLVKDGQIEFPEDFQSDEPDGEGLYKNLIISSDISTIDLYKWAAQIASGMGFLESKKVLHADLAARNILLTEELVVKISDFGLSRDLFTSSEYTKKTQVLLPWKWMAPEALRYLKFSTKTDVWAFGVTLHEMFTLGEEPYLGMNWNEEFIASLEDGTRLTRPPFCTLNVFNEIMLKCWEKEPDDRLDFQSAQTFFEKCVSILTSTPRNNEECQNVC